MMPARAVVGAKADIETGSLEGVNVGECVA
jgi:hypothetical protein